MVKQRIDAPTRYSLRLLCGLLLFAWLMSGCIQLPALNPTEPGSLLFQDDFSRREGGWPSRIDSGGLADYLESAYRLQVGKANSARHATPGLRLNNVRVEVTAGRISGPANNAFGIICRYQDTANYYAFLVSSDGYYAILKVKDGQQTLLGADTMLPHPALQDAAAVVRIQAVCDGSELSLSANDNLIATTQDDEYQRGDVGIIAAAISEPGVDILYDDFKVTVP